MNNNNEDNKFDLITQKLEEVTSSQPIINLKQRNFFWDSVILSVAVFISGLSISGILAELFSDENSVACFTNYTNRNDYTFINSYCHKDLPKAKYFRLVVLGQVTLLVATHYGWKVVFSAKFESFLSHVAKVEILREKSTGKYPYHNYTIVNYLQREFGDSWSILFFYILKLIFQIAIVCCCFAANKYVLEDITKFDVTLFYLTLSDITKSNITFKCNDDDQLFDKQLFNNVTCVYPRKDEINILVRINYILLVVALLMLIFGLFWIFCWNHSKTKNNAIANLCYYSCIDPQYCYNLPKRCNFPLGCLQMRDDFTLLLASLHYGYRRVFRTIIIEDKIRKKFRKHSKKLDKENNCCLHDIKNCLKKAFLVIKMCGMWRQNKVTTGAGSSQHVEEVNVNLLSKFIPALCQEIANPGGNESDSVILDIASGYHSYMLDISKNCKEKVVSVILGSHHGKKIETIENSEPSIVVISMKTPLNTSKGTEMKFTDELSGYIGGKLNLIVVGPLDSEHKQSTVNQIVNEKKLFKANVVMLVIKLIKLGKKDISDNFFDCNPDKSSWEKKEFKNNRVIEKGIKQGAITKESSNTYEMKVTYQGSKCELQLKFYDLKQQKAANDPPVGQQSGPIVLIEQPQD